MNNGFRSVQDVLENYQSAVYDQDAEKFLSSYDANVQIYDCWESWKCSGRAEWEKSVHEWFSGLKEEGVLLKVDFDDLSIEENTDLAFIHCSVTYAAYNESDEKLRHLTNRFTFGLKKENAFWLIIHEHSSLPISMETGKGIFDLK